MHLFKSFDFQQFSEKNFMMNSVQHYVIEDNSTPYFIIGKESLPRRIIDGDLPIREALAAHYNAFINAGLATTPKWSSEESDSASVPYQEKGMARGIRKIVFHPESPGPLVPVGSPRTGLPDSVRDSDNPDTTAVGRILTAEEKDRITMALRRIRFGQPPEQPGYPHLTPEAGL